MNTIDIIILICFLPAVISGIRKGFVAQVISLASVLAGAWLAFHFSQIVSEWLAGYLKQVSPNVLHIIAFTAVVTVVILLMALVSKALQGVIKIAMLGWLDRLLGVVLALVTTALIVSIALVLVSYLDNLFHLIPKDVIAGSKLFQPVKDLAYDVFPYLKAVIAK